MPYLAPKKSAAAAVDLSWDAFPPPPPEAEHWEPDPDSIARPGDLPDARFSRGRCDVYRKAALKKENKLGLKSASPAVNEAAPAVNGAAPAHSGLGAWPAQVLRATGYPRDLVNITDSAPSLSSVGSSAETHQPHTPAVTMASERSLSAVKGLMHAWAAPLEKALAENAQKAHNQSAKLYTQPTKTHTVSVPPHLRKNVKSTVDSIGHLDPTARSYEPRIGRHNEKAWSVSTITAAETLVSQEDELDDEALARRLATTDLGVGNAEQELQLQEIMLNECKGKAPCPLVPPTSLPTSNRPRGSYSRWLKSKLVMIMEEDLDLSKRATKRELLMMTDDEVNHYLQKVSSAHEHWWKAEQMVCFDSANSAE